MLVYCVDINQLSVCYLIILFNDYIIFCLTTDTKNLKIKKYFDFTLIDYLLIILTFPG